MEKKEKFYQKWYFKTILFLILSMTLILALNNNEKNKDYYDKLHNSLSLYNKTYKKLITNYVDPINPEKLTEQSINNLTDKLDPYTTLLNKRQKKSVEQLSEGKYGGIGVRITIRNDTVTAVAPMEGGPAIRAGIQPGDQILKVDSIETKGMALSKVSETIRGKKGTKVKLTIKRPGVSGTTVYELTRASINIPKISYSGMVNDSVGYIKMSRFSKGAAQEFAKSVKKLSQNNSGFSKLIFDLRMNPGGLLREALGIAEMFIPPGDTLLFTKGRTDRANRVIKAHRQPIINSDMELAVLINNGSASASEIVAGIIQDYDRGLVIGRRSFGKGLVQRVIELDKKHSLKLTNAKYYIPSGRCVQKPGFIKNKDLVVEKGQKDSVYYTKNGRKVIGGGGIKPDITVKQEDYSGFRYTAFLVSKNIPYNFAIKYKTTHDTIPDYDKIGEKIVNDFKEYVAKQDVEYEYKNEKKLQKIEKSLSKKDDISFQEDTFQKIYSQYNQKRENEFEENRKMIKRQLEEEFATLKGGSELMIEATLKYDNVISRTLKALKKRQEYDTVLGFSGK